MAEIPVAAWAETHGVRMSDHTITAESGSRIILSEFRKLGSHSAQPVACILYIHGGGFTSCDRFFNIEEVVRLVSSDDIAAFTVEYRLAPDDPYPAALDDCEAAVLWIADNADSLGIDSARIMVFGVSAGGGLAASLALRVRDSGCMSIAALLLSCPMLDNRTTSGPGPAGGVRTWGYDDNRAAWAVYLGTAPGTGRYSVPGLAVTLERLPTTFIDVGTDDIFLDEDVRFAHRLRADGVPAELRLWRGGYHGFDLIEPDSTMAKAAVHARSRWIREVLGL